jgi:hypothetical protein
MTTNKTPGPSGTQPDRFLEDISADELFSNAPAGETNDDKNARRELTGSVTNNVDVSMRASPYGTSQRRLTKLKAGSILPLNSASCLSLR